jgi:DNA-binding PadR family transcriptional regulator
MNPGTGKFLPLAPAMLHILIALAGEDLHGYGIMKEISRQTDGAYNLGPGTLYDNLQRLIAQGIVRQVKLRIENDDPRRRYYQLTSLGRDVLSAEIARLERTLRDAKLKVRNVKQVRT